MKVVALLVALLLLCEGCGSLAANRGAFGALSDKAEDMSLVALLSQPQSFAGKQIRVAGVLLLGYEGDSLCLDLDSWRHVVRHNCVWLGLDLAPFRDSYPQLSRWNGHYALVEGTVSAIAAADASSPPTDLNWRTVSIRPVAGILVKR